MGRLLLAGWLAVVVAGCASPACWRELAVVDLPAAGGPPSAVVYVELPGRELSDRMVAEALPAAEVAAALAAGGWRPCRIDGFAAARHYAEWVGSGEGMGVVVFDADGQVLGTRPGPQDAAELAAYLRLAARRRVDVAAARQALAAHRGADELLRLAALATLLIPLGSLAGIWGIGGTWNHHGAGFAVDATALAAVPVFLLLAHHTRKRMLEGHADSVWSAKHEPAVDPGASPQEVAVSK